MNKVLKCFLGFIVFLGVIYGVLINSLYSFYSYTFEVPVLKEINSVLCFNKEFVERMGNEDASYLIDEDAECNGISYHLDRLLFTEENTTLLINYKESEYDQVFMDVSIKTDTGNIPYLESSFSYMASGNGQQQLIYQDNKRIKNSQWIEIVINSISTIQGDTVFDLDLEHLTISGEAKDFKFISFEKSDNQYILTIESDNDLPKKFLHFSDDAHVLSTQKFEKKQIYTFESENDTISVFREGFKQEINAIIQVK